MTRTEERKILYGDFTENIVLCTAFRAVRKESFGITTDGFALREVIRASGSGLSINTDRALHWDWEIQSQFLLDPDREGVDIPHKI